MKVQVSRLIDVLYGQEHPRGAHIVIFYQAEIRSGTLKAEDDVDSADFFPPEALPPLAFSTTVRILAEHFGGEG